MESIETKSKWLLEFSKDLLASSNKEENPFRSFNIFEVLDIKAKEVLMCRMLRELLSPTGSHNKGCEFLKEFVSAVADERFQFSSEELDSPELKVVTEKVINEKRRIDILIKTNSQIIPIEVKIYASDQDNQVRDYLDYCETVSKLNFKDSERCNLLYLTLDGHYPSENSTGIKLENDTEKNKDQRIICISFKDHIRKFLNKCLKHNLDESTEANIKQYLYAIESISGVAAVDDNIIEKISEKINTKDDFVAIEYLQASAKQRKLNLMRLLFEETTQKLKDKFKEDEHIGNLILGYSDEGSNHFEHDTNLNNFFEHRSKPHPCLFWEFATVKSNADNHEFTVAITLEFEWRPYVGVLLTYKGKNGKFYNPWWNVSKDNFKPKNRDVINSVQEKLTNIGYKLQETSSTWWVDWARVSADEIYAEEKDSPDFKNANSEKYYRLYEKTVRDKLTDNIVKRFELYVDALNKIDGIKKLPKKDS